MSEKDLALLRSALDPNNQEIVEALARKLFDIHWVADTTYSSIVRELLAVQRAYAGLGVAGEPEAR